MWIDTVSKLNKALDDILETPYISVDTEYDSLRYFREKLCLIQIATEATTYLFDPLAELDLSPLGAVFANPKILKILHAGDNDIRLLKRDYGFKIRNIFDTHRAALLIGSQKLSLTSVINEYIGVSVEKRKKIQKSAWDSRPLSADQIAYATQDTKYLLPLYIALLDKLKQLELLEKALEDFQKTIAIEWKEKAFKYKKNLKIKGFEELNANQQEKLQSLFRWRFEKARQTNIACFMILSDQNLVDLCRHNIDSIESIHAIAAISHPKAKLFGKEILRTLKAGS